MTLNESQHLIQKHVELIFQILSVRKVASMDLQITLLHAIQAKCPFFTQNMVALLDNITSYSSQNFKEVITTKSRSHAIIKRSTQMGMRIQITSKNATSTYAHQFKSHGFHSVV
jgi:hypothetical protein